MLPERFGRYEVLAEIGDGSMGRVYSAWDPNVSRVVAIKTIKAELLTSDTAAEYLKRFRHEAVAVGAINHAQVVRVFDIGDDFLVMEFVEGRTLQSKIREAGRIEPAETLRLLGPVAEAVDHAHAAGIIHRDIKPANVMIQSDGQPKLMDFGVAHLASSVMTTAGQVLGSPSYMSPEQIAGTTLTGRSDVYSLAVVAYEMLTGQPPFQGQSITQVIYRVMHESAPPPRRWNAALPARYDDVFARALAKDPAERHATATAFVAALDLRELEFVLDPIADAPPAPPENADAILTLVQLPGEADGGPVSLPAPVPPAAPPPAPAARGRLLPAALVLFAGFGFMAVAAIGWAAWHRAPAAPVADTPATTLPVVATATPEVPAVPVSPTPSPTPAPRTIHIARSEPPVPKPTPSPTPAPVVEGQLVELADDVTAPVRTQGAPAPYPERARHLHLEGSVTVAMIVDENGMPTELQVVESGGPILDAAVLESVRGWRFEPARKAGVKVKVRWTARQTYRSR